MDQLKRMREDDLAITDATYSADVGGLNTYQATVLRAEAAVEARRAVFTPLSIDVCYESECIETEQLCEELRAFYSEHGHEIEQIHAAHEPVRAALEQALEAEDRAVMKERKRQLRNRQAARMNVGVA